MFNKLKKLASKITKAGTKTKSLLALILVLTFTASAGAIWGPNRPAFDYNDPDGRKGSLNGPVFNSMKNTPTYGDEFNFTTAKKTSDQTWSNDLKVKDGDEVEIRLLVHNNANINTNESGLGIAKDVKAGLDLPQNQYGTKIEPIGYVSASNSAPKEVFDSTAISSADGRRFRLNYVPGSSQLQTIGNKGGFPGGVTLNDGFIGKNGIPVGSNALDGIWKGCFEYYAYITVKVKVTGEPKEEKPAVQIEKNVSTEKIGVNQEFKYTLDVKNTGNVDLNNVKVDDPAPANISFVRTEPTTGVDFTFSSSRVQATIAQLKVGETKRLTIVAKVTKYVPNQIINTACVDAPEVPGEKDDCDDAPITPVEFCPIPGKENLPVGSPECKITQVTPPQTTPSTGSGTLITIASTLSIAGATYALSRKFAKS
jgi:uncharacterized repeat protein (TIGR01451 family)